MIQIKTSAFFSFNMNAGNGPDAVHRKIRWDVDMPAAGDDMDGRLRRRRMEIFAFLFLTAILMPALAVATVGSYGLAVWIYQVIAGPPGPPPPPGR